MPSHVSDSLRQRPALARPRRKRTRKPKPIATPGAGASAPAARRRAPHVPPIKAPDVLTVSARRWHRATTDEAVVPYLRMCGRWLEKHGFPIGGKVHVTVTQGRVILSNTDDTRADAVAGADEER
jgi:Toxin SymE, type I toxin-antitoxin system